MKKRWTILVIPAMLAAGSYLFAEEVTERDETVDQDNNVGAGRDELGAAVDDANGTLSKTFNPPPNRTFRDFRQDEGAGTKPEKKIDLILSAGWAKDDPNSVVEAADAITVNVITADFANANAFPITADGNLATGGGGGSQPPEIHWAAIVQAFKVDLIIHNGLEGVSGGQAIAEADEETTGAVTVANLNDTDGDGTKDKDDNDVSVAGANPPGRDEHDLMKLILKKPVPDNGGNVTLTVVSGNVKLWTQKTKVTEIVLNNGSVDFATSDLNKTIWVEARAVSPKLRDIELRLSYQGATDTVKATGLWVDHKKSYRVRAANGADNAIPNGLDRQSLKDILTNNFDNNGDVAKDGSRYGIGTFAALTVAGALVDQRIGGRILHEFEVKPHGVSGLGVTFDVTRNLAQTNRYMNSGGTLFEASNEKDKVYPEDETKPLDNETPNDDSGSTDEDNDPTGTNLIYSYDIPSIARDTSNNALAYAISRMQFREWVRVRLDGANFANQNGVVEGSRSSNHVPWYLLDYLVRDANDNWVPDTAAVSYSAPVDVGTGNGSMSVTLGANPVTEGFIAAYDLANQKWTLTGTSGDTNSATQAGAIPAGTQWNITIGNKVSVTITQGNAAFANGDQFGFSIFKTSAMSGKKNEIKEGTIDPTDGP